MSVLTTKQQLKRFVERVLDGCPASADEVAGMFAGRSVTASVRTVFARHPEDSSSAAYFQEWLMSSDVVMCEVLRVDGRRGLSGRGCSMCHKDSLCGKRARPGAAARAVLRLWRKFAAPARAA